MKERYIAPEVEVLCFAPVENLATDIDFGDLIGGGGGTGSTLPGVGEKESGDVLIPLIPQG